MTYTDGNFSNNLYGTEFELEESEDVLCLSINMDCNLRVRNKDANNYTDACDLAYYYEVLESIQIDDPKVIKGLIAGHSNRPHAHWKLILRLGVKGIFRYAASPKPECSGSSVVFNIHEVLLIDPLP